VTWNFDVIYSGQINTVYVDVLVNNTLANQSFINNTANITYYDGDFRLIDILELHEGTTIIDTLNPSVEDLYPAPGDNINQSTSFLITVNVTDFGVLDTVYINLTYPDSSSIIIDLNYNSSTGLYEYFFTNTSNLGTYSYRVFANDTVNNINNSESTFFNVINAKATDPTNITCNGGSCSGNFNTYIDINCSGSVDPNGDPITYYIDALYLTPRGDRQLVNSSFETDTQGFIYGDDFYGTAAPVQALGSRVTDGNCSSGSCLNVELNINTPTTGPEFSGGWNKSFNVSGFPNYVNITFYYKARLDDLTEGTEYIDIMLRNLTTGDYYSGARKYGVAGTDFNDEIITGSYTYNVFLVDGEYSFDVGCRVVLDSVPDGDQTSENGDCWIDDVMIKQYNATDSTQVWEEIGLHNETSVFRWDILNEKMQSGVDFRCRAKDDGSGLFTDYYTSGANGTIIDDILPPWWLNNKTYPYSPATYVKNGNYQFNITWMDNTNVDNVSIEHNFTGVIINDSNVNRYIYEYFVDISDLAVGTYYWKSYAIDPANNTNVTDVFVYEVVKADPNCSLTFNVASPQEYGTLVNASCYCLNTDS
jgi:hypothetical protein